MKEKTWEVTMVRDYQEPNVEDWNEANIGFAQVCLDNELTYADHAIQFETRWVEGNYEFTFSRRFKDRG